MFKTQGRIMVQQEPGCLRRVKTAAISLSLFPAPRHHNNSHQSAASGLAYVRSPIPAWSIASRPASAFGDTWRARHRLLFASLNVTTTDPSTPKALRHKDLAV